MGEWSGRQVEIEVTNVAHGGVAVARHEGRVIFVSDAIPGETVLARITDDSKESFWRAETLSVVEASEFRRPHIWPAAGIDRAPEDRAGGAEFGHIVTAHQRELKRQVLADSLQRMAGIQTDVTVDALPGAEDGTGWRTRVRLHVAADGRPGPYAARSHRVISVDDLPLAVPELAAIAPLEERFPGIDHIDVVVPSLGNPFVLTSGAQRTDARKQGRKATGQRPKAQRILERVGDRDFRLDARGFWQVHRHAAQTLTTAVQEAVDANRFDPRAANLDLYGGVGLLAAALGDRFGSALRITTVESDPLATDHAAENLSEWVGAAAITARVENYVTQLGATASSAERDRLARGSIVLDPPRSGAGKAVVREIAALRPAQVVYVACDPVALARDVALFGGFGYELTRLRAFDLFPNTHHVEAVATLVPAEVF
ncbi:MAG TPA: TRAM domain-containing protein [Lacisediminihabitans sp.]|uniref:class I SAM-dependent RNA methyltransferase n=1 Tax=Lacisediminihabitans sp. TaxID=2787631 RepID=UPI002ED804D3